MLITGVEEAMSLSPTKFEKAVVDTRALQVGAVFVAAGYQNVLVTRCCRLA